MVSSVLKLFKMFGSMNWVIILLISVLIFNYYTIKYLNNTIDLLKINHQAIIVYNKTLNDLNNTDKLFDVELEEIDKKGESNETIIQNPEDDKLIEGIFKRSYIINFDRLQ